MIVYVVDVRESTKTLKLINEFTNVMGYKINTQNSTVFLLAVNNWKLKF